MSDVSSEKSLTNGQAKAPFWHATPELDVYESGTEYLIVLDVPGASADSVNVEVIGTDLFVRAEQAPSPQHADIALAAFERRLELPSEVDSSSAVAELRDGVLEIRIQKSPTARRVKIPVSAN
jgi:HSP20 family protein